MFVQDPLCGRTAPRSVVCTSSGFDSPAALPAEWRVLARQGWAGEMSDLFEHPAGMYCYFERVISQPL